MTDNEKTLNMQKFLNKYYHAGLAEDGMYGSKTKAAVKRMQEELGGIDADGWWGTDTQIAVQKRHGTAPTVTDVKRSNGRQRTSYEDLKFLYRNPPSGNIASTGTATPATATSSASNSTSSPSLSPQSTQSETAGNKSHIGNAILPSIVLGITNAFHNGNGFSYFKNFFNSNFGLHPRAHRYRRGLYGFRSHGNSQPDVTAMRYGGKILMDFITR